MATRPRDAAPVLDMSIQALDVKGDISFSLIFPSICDYSSTTYFWPRSGIAVHVKGILIVADKKRLRAMMVSGRRERIWTATAVGGPSPLPRLSPGHSCPGLNRFAALPVHPWLAPTQTQMSGGPEIAGRRFAAATIGGHLELNFLTFVQSAQTGLFNRGNVDECAVATVVVE